MLALVRARATIWLAGDVPSTSAGIATTIARYLFGPTYDRIDGPNHWFVPSSSSQLNGMVRCLATVTGPHGGSWSLSASQPYQNHWPHYSYPHSLLLPFQVLLIAMNRILIRRCGFDATGPGAGRVCLPIRHYILWMKNHEWIYYLPLKKTTSYFTEPRVIERERPTENKYKTQAICCDAMI